MTTLTADHGADANIDDLGGLRKARRHPTNKSLRGPTGPTAKRGKRKSRSNAIKHGIFAVGLVRGRESCAEYRKIVAGIVESLQPVRRFEEILVEKLAMLFWRYRRCLRAEAAEIARNAESAEDRNLEEGISALTKYAYDKGMLAPALVIGSEMGLRLAVDDLRGLRQLISEEGLDWERDRDVLTGIFGPDEKGGPRSYVTYKSEPKTQLEPNPDVEEVRKYRELTLKDKDRDPESRTDVAADAARQMVSILDKTIKVCDRVLRRWMIRKENRDRQTVAIAPVPQKEVIDRLQRYEASLERSFDRTLSQLERMQRLRLGQPVLPALKVDISH